MPRRRPSAAKRAIVAARGHPIDEGEILGLRDAGALRPLGELLGIGAVGERLRRMIVEREQRLGIEIEPAEHVVDGVEREGLPTHVQTMIDSEAAALDHQRGHHRPAGIQAAQARLPGRRQAEIRGRHAIGCERAIGFPEGDGVVEGDPRSRHQRTLEGVAMHIDDAGQHDEPRRIEPEPPAAHSTSDDPIALHRHVADFERAVRP